VLSVEDEVVSSRAHSHGCPLAEQDKGKNVAILSIEC
jgi:hypothetical protein